MVEGGGAMLHRIPEGVFTEGGGMWLLFEDRGFYRFL